MAKTSTKEKKSGYPCTGEGVFWSSTFNAFRINVAPKNLDYDQKVAEIKAIEGKWWSKKNLCWYVPAQSYFSIISYIRKWRVAATNEAVDKAKKLYWQDNPKK